MKRIAASKKPAASAEFAKLLAEAASERGDLAVALVRDIAEADAKVVAVNASLPDGSDPLDTVEARSRWIPYLPKIVTETRLTAWTFSDETDPLPDQIAGAIEVDATDPNAGWWTDPATVVGEAASRHRGIPQHPGTRRGLRAVTSGASR
ncbi:hypothetical protein [Chelatococcus asaccharovorans]|uniref:hypothetical protein n=1 Tax=Chelatococcus asaccharovorans TaxID=28210 RepID=UPI0011B497E7|nr:hypothetical protein [Chelatococcus asaccharovorans]MBS7702671.1 hypothetical protein [Chelatococcus asaccharovorans]